MNNLFTKKSDLIGFYNDLKADKTDLLQMLLIAKCGEVELFLDKDENNDVYLVAEDTDVEFYYERVDSEEDLIDKVKEQYMSMLFEDVT